MEERAHQKKISRWECEELMVLFGTISTFGEAEAELRGERTERDKERSFILGQLAGTLFFNLFLYYNPSLKN